MQRSRKGWGSSAVLEWSHAPLSLLSYLLERIEALRKRIKLQGGTAADVEG